MRKYVGLMLAIVFLFALLAGCINQEQTQTTSQTSFQQKQGIHFYMFGAYYCPHCANMKELITKHYGKDALTYYEVADEKEPNYNRNVEKFTRLSQYTGTTGVPQTGVFVNGSLRIIIVGEVSYELLTKILDESKAGKVLLVLDKIYITEDPEVIKALESIFKG
jgi:glutaredoxin